MTKRWTWTYLKRKACNLKIFIDECVIMICAFWWFPNIKVLEYEITATYCFSMQNREGDKRKIQLEKGVKSWHQPVFEPVTLECVSKSGFVVTFLTLKQDCWLVLIEK